MSGVRIHHPTLRNCTYRLWEPGYACPEAADGWRYPKMRPLLIDNNGDTIVSEHVWRALEKGRALGRITDEFILMNGVPNPPKLRVGGAGVETAIVERRVNDAIRQIAPGVSTFSVVPSTKYRSDAARIARAQHPSSRKAQ